MAGHAKYQSENSFIALTTAKLKRQWNKKKKWFGDLLNFSVDVIYQTARTFEPLTSKTYFKNTQQTLDLLL